MEHAQITAAVMAALTGGDDDMDRAAELIDGMSLQERGALVDRLEYVIRLLWGENR